jgi:hypothetical protein
MNDTQRALLEHLAAIVLTEHRPATVQDFLNFQTNGKSYSLQASTVRNYISHLSRLGEVELDYYSGCAFYTLPGHHAGVPPYHQQASPHERRVSRSRDLSGLIARLAFGTAACHNLRLRFKCSGIYYALLALAPASELAERRWSMDLALQRMQLDTGLSALVTVHKSDVVSVILACSEVPIKFDVSGLVRLSCALARIEERLRALIGAGVREHHSAANISAEPLPDSCSWIVCMWHINIDSLQSYSGEKFECSWKSATGELIRVYSKQMKRKGKDITVIRNEVQEYPHDPIHTAVERKLSAILSQ